MSIALRKNRILAVVLVLTTWVSNKHDSQSTFFANAANVTIANTTVTTNATTTNSTNTTGTSAGQPSSPTPTYIGPKCYSSISQIILAEALIKDTTKPRVYTVCENTRNTVVKVDFYNQIVDGGQAMIPLRPNMHLKCGDGGRRDGNCIISDGDLLLDGTSQFGVTDASLDNVLIEGFTFAGSGLYAAELTKPGRVVFRDCVFKDAVNATAAVVADYYSAFDTTQKLEVKFEKCDFTNNVYNWRGGRAAVVVGNSIQNSLIFTQCRFSGNDMTFNNTNVNTNSFLIESAGPLEMVNNCFDSNKVGVAPAAVYTGDFLAAGNYGNGTTGVLCAFAAKYDDPQRFELNAPLCVNYDVTECGISSTYSPISSPTGTPTSASPTFPVTEEPTSSTDSPTYTPTIPPTPKPSVMPTSFPTGSSATLVSFQAMLSLFIVAIATLLQ